MRTPPCQKKHCIQRSSAWTWSLLDGCGVRQRHVCRQAHGGVSSGHACVRAGRQPLTSRQALVRRERRRAERQVERRPRLVLQRHDAGVGVALRSQLQHDAAWAHSNEPARRMGEGAGREM
eukprot:6929161-Prymnesium_polylepis.1